MQLTILPWYSEAGFYINIYGADYPTSSSGSLTFLGSTSDIVYFDTRFDCVEREIYFNDLDVCNGEGPYLTDFQYLVFRVSTIHRSTDDDANALLQCILDNISMCKLLEINLHDDCLSPCVEIAYDESCFVPNCEEEGCLLIGIVSFDHGDPFEFSYEDEPWADHVDCFEIPTNATEMDLIFQASYVGIPDDQYICFHHEFGECGDFDITDDTDWGLTHDTPPFEHFNTLTVKSGYSLTVDADQILRFCDGGKLIVEPRATLNLYGTLTSNCNAGWNGVEVQGNSSVSQYASGGHFPQGVINCYENSIIENAFRAVQLYGPTAANAGGQINADGAIFTNNCQGIVFAPFNNYFNTASKPRPYFSRIRNCIFDITGDFDPDKTFFYHIFMYNVFGINISGCKFIDNHVAQPISGFDQYSIGIESFGSNFTIGPSAANILDEPCPAGGCSDMNPTEFTGLRYGVDAYSFSGNYPFTVYYSKFSKCSYGINVNQVSGASILHNRFEFGDLQQVNTSDDQLGIKAVGPIQNIDIQEDTFDLVGEMAENTLGVVMENLGTKNIIVRRNYFHGITIGDEAFGENAQHDLKTLSGLAYECNENSHVTAFDFYVPDSRNERDIIRKLQCNNGFSQFLEAANTFSNYGDPDEGDFSNHGNFAPMQVLVEYHPVDYFYHVNNSSDKPDKYFGIQNLVEGLPNACLPNDCLQPCLSSVDFSDEVDSFYTYWEDFNIALANDDQDGVAFHKCKADSSIDKVTRYLELDTANFIRDTLRAWYLRDSSISGDLLLAGDFFATGDYTEMDDVLDNIHDRFDLSRFDSFEIERIKYAYDILTARSINSLTSSDIDSLLVFAASPGYSTAIARGILALSGDTILTPAYYIPGEVDPRSNQNTKSVNMAEASQLLLFPNPTGDNISIFVEAKVQDPVLVVYDLNGMAISRINLHGGLNDISIQKDWKPGLYYCSLIGKGIPIRSGKFVVIK
ncbi:MAG: T9SS type A sorting domain-containing protein [Saprospiraceae bacterium]|uniref:T9SS type A sorting domain-containing protein n=1 Tax=Candidatus Opimibacter skivensis TaxID=2982028 RepID=A0A9D7XTF3_9BACT|nr:T9SS type A sorting domain-containing protein [Candidatus Opimibacter skivensis]